MFVKPALIVLATACLSSAASLAGRAPNNVASQCDTGDAQCCNSVQSSNDPATSSLLGLLGIVLQGVDVPIGITCTPIPIIGLAQGANCAQQPVCCQNNNFNGLVSIGCTPISL